MQDEPKPQCPMCGDMGGPEFWSKCKAVTCEMRDGRAAQEVGLPPLLTDEQIDACWDGLTPSGYGKSRYNIARAIESEVRTAIAAAGGGVPQGWKLVPVEPTREMRAAFDKADAEAREGTPLGDPLILYSPDHQWAAMLASSPQPEAEPSEAEQVCMEAYQVVGSLLSDLGVFETDEAEKILDNLCAMKRLHKDVLPWPSFAQPETAPKSNEPLMPGECMASGQGHSFGPHGPNGERQCAYCGEAAPAVAQVPQGWTKEKVDTLWTQIVIALHSDDIEKLDGRVWEARRRMTEAILGLASSPQPEAAPAVAQPAAYRYKYPDGYWRFSNGERINGCDPIESQPLYTSQHLSALEEAPAVAQVPQESKSLTDAYAEGRGDQYEDDCRAVRLLFENLDDADELSDGHINTTRVRELLSHFAAAPEAPAQAAQSAGEVERALRRMLCVLACGRTAYMDDGEAQDNSVHPNIDFMRDTPAEIQRKLFYRSAALSHKEPQR